MRMYPVFYSFFFQILKSDLEGSSVELHHARMKISELGKELSVLNEDRENLLSRVKELATGFESQNNIQVPNAKSFGKEVVFSKKY